MVELWPKLPGHVEDELVAAKRARDKECVARAREQERALANQAANERERQRTEAAWITED